jgi:hypothetical protein
MTAPLAPLLALTQWLSPAFPTGAFAYSHGLEQVVADGTVHDEATFHTWLRGILWHGAGRQDGALLVRGLAPAAALDTLDAMARALAPSAERLAETLEQGAAFARAVAATTGRPLPPRALPLAVAEAARPLACRSRRSRPLPAGLRRQPRDHRHPPCAAGPVRRAARPRAASARHPVAGAGPRGHRTRPTSRPRRSGRHDHETKDVRLFRT